MRTSMRMNALAVATALVCTACANTTTSSGRGSAPPTASGASTEAPSGPQSVNPASAGTIPVGQEIDVRLASSLNSGTASVEQRFDTTTVVDLLQDGRVLLPAGTVVRGVVSEVDKAGRIDRNGSLTLTFDQVKVAGRDRDIRASATHVFESRGIRDEGVKAGVGAGVGGVVGGILGGLQGALLGAAIGAGGAIVATDGKDISLPAGSVIRIRMDSPASVG